LLLFPTYNLDRFLNLFNKEIADELFPGVRSVEKIRQDMKEKTGVR
jgi:hypothetical protein